MTNSRSIDDLHPTVAALCREFLARCKASGIDVLVTCTYRDPVYQNLLHAQGRTPASKARGEKIVTHARGGDSLHNYRVAFDIVPLRNGKPTWSERDPAWNLVGQIGTELGLEWAGNWASFKEFPHFQFTGGLTLADFKAGKLLPDQVQP